MKISKSTLFKSAHAIFKMQNVTFHNKGVKVKNSYGYSDEDLRDTMFEKITDEHLQKSLDDTLKLFS